jgi:hypothetical protein
LRNGDLGLNRVDVGETRAAGVAAVRSCHAGGAGSVVSPADTPAAGDFPTEVPSSVSMFAEHPAQLGSPREWLGLALEDFAGAFGPLEGREFLPRWQPSRSVGPCLTADLTQRDSARTCSGKWRLGIV